MSNWQWRFEYCELREQPIALITDGSATWQYTFTELVEAFCDMAQLSDAKLRQLNIDCTEAERHDLRRQLNGGG